MTSIDDWLQRLDHVLQSSRPNFYSNLRPGASAEDLALLEEKLGFAVPEDFKAFLRWKDGWDLRGEEPDRKDCFVPYTFYPLSHEVAICTYEGEREIYELRGRRQQPSHWSPHWIPFLRDNHTDIYYIDVGGSFNGKQGQVLLSYDGGLDQVNILCESFGKWVETITVAYERDILSFDEEDEWAIHDAHYAYYELIEELNPGHPLIIDSAEHFTPMEHNPL